jgi:C1A family cysteine protease
MHGRRYGWIPDHPRLALARYSAQAPVALPAEVDLRPLCPEVWDQKRTNGCVGFMLAAMIDQIERKMGRVPKERPAPLFLYYNGREKEHSTASDCGVMIHNAVTAGAELGFSSESLCPFGENVVLERPSQAAYDEARRNDITEHMRLDRRIYDIKHSLAEGFSVGAGITIYGSFETPEVAKSGIIPMPNHGEEFKGAHAVLIVGYSMTRQVWIVRNSWGWDWGIKGYFELPFAFLMEPDLSADVQTIRLAA